MGTRVHRRESGRLSVADASKFKDARRPFGSTTSLFGLELAAIVKWSAEEGFEGWEAIGSWLQQCVSVTTRESLLGAEFLRAYGEFLRKSEDFESAAEHFQLAREMFSIDGDFIQAASIDRDLAITFMALNKEPLAIHHLRQASSIYEDSGYDEALTFVALQLASILHEYKSFRDALAAANIAKTTSKRIKYRTMSEVIDQLIRKIRADALLAGARL